MNRDKKLKIKTLGRFSVSLDGIAVAKKWPNEKTKVLFCSLLSPMGSLVSWDWLCRSMLGVAETRDSSQRLNDTVIQPLISFMHQEFGFNPLITDDDGITIDQQRIHLDASEFYSTTVEGIRLLSFGNGPGVIDKFNRAKALYGGSYLPEMSGNIIKRIRTDLDTLYRTTVMDDMPLKLIPSIPV